MIDSILNISLGTFLQFLFINSSLSRAACISLHIIFLSYLASFLPKSIYLPILSIIYIYLSILYIYLSILYIYISIIYIYLSILYIYLSILYVSIYIIYIIDYVFTYDISICNMHYTVCSSVSYKACLEISYVSSLKLERGLSFVPVFQKRVLLFLCFFLFCLDFNQF